MRSCETRLILAPQVNTADQLLAVSQTWVGLVESMKRAVGSVMAVIVGAAFFSEPAGLGKILAVLLVGAGVALVML